jgi:glycosyltransferase involved in cell wall biosynthesis
MAISLLKNFPVRFRCSVFDECIKRPERKKAMNSVKYSICVPNLNMGNSLVSALSSVLSQLDSRFEVIVIDDGSTDDSLVKLNQLKHRFPGLRTIFLEKDPERTLAETRNISVREARGEYCLLHIDCDDIWEPYILEFVKVFHCVEKLVGEDILLSGHQINMARRGFLLEHGPYKHWNFGEDKDMWYRLGLLERYIPIDHVVFRHRMPLNTRQKLVKKYISTGRNLSEEIRFGRKFSYYISNIWKNHSNHPIKFRLYFVRIVLYFVLPSYPCVVLYILSFLLFFVRQL